MFIVRIIIGDNGVIATSDFSFAEKAVEVYGYVCGFFSGLLDKGEAMGAATCAYCDKGTALAAFGIEIQKLDAATVYLFKEQSHPGRVIVAANKHVANLTDLSDAERDAFFADVARAGKALQKAFNPDKINYGAYGDTSGHLHFHLVPKYRDGFEWGSTFAMNPGEKFLDDKGNADVIAKIKAAL